MMSIETEIQNIKILMEIMLSVSTAVLKRGVSAMKILKIIHTSPEQP